MQLVFLYLKTRNFLPEKSVTIELFGMHGLWHTKDYISLVHSLDIFELDKTYHNQSKKVLNNFNVNYFNQDSIKWLKSTENKYNLVISDSPAAEMFYTENGIPYFFSDLINVCSKNAVIIFNCMIHLLPDQNNLERLILRKCQNKIVKNLAFFPRSDKIMYIVLILE